MTVNSSRPRTVPEMAFYIEGVERTIDEKLDSFGDRIEKLEKSIDTLKHLLITSLLAPVIVLIVAGLIMKDVAHA